MPEELNGIVAISFVVLLALSAMRARRTGAWVSFVLEASALAVVGAVLNYLFGFPVPRSEISMGLADDLRHAIPLFVAMITGMAGGTTSSTPTIARIDATAGQKRCRMVMPDHQDSNRRLQP
jgi:hypothetical protein